MASVDGMFPETSQTDQGESLGDVTPGTTVSNAEEEETIVPRDSDVLCGRGGKALRHPGNQTYRRLVNLNKGLYTTCMKSEKLKISKSIVAAVREQNGRFLEKDSDSGKWYDIGDKKAVEKTSQALREGQPKTRKKIAEFGGGAAGAQALLESQLAEEHLREQARISSGAMPGDSMGMPPGAGGLPDYPSMDANELAAAAGFPELVTHLSPSGRRLLQPMSDTLSQLPRERQMSGYQGGRAGNDEDYVPPPLGPIETRDVSMELLKLSLGGNESAAPAGHQPTLPPHNEVQRAAVVPPAAVRLRPSLTPKGSQVKDELGMGTAQTSSLSLMSDFSNFGEESTMSLEGDEQAAGSRMNSIMREFGMTTPSSSLSPKNSLQPGASFGRTDRRTLFARMKYSRPSSEFSDGMPAIHLVESTQSVLSNMSGVGDDSKPAASDQYQVPAASAGARAVGDVYVESRRSLMSGLSRISDNSEVHSIFSDLSRKIGNVSTRSIPMDEISIMEGTADDMLGETPLTPLKKTSVTMDMEKKMSLTMDFDKKPSLTMDFDKKPSLTMDFD